MKFKVESQILDVPNPFINTYVTQFVVGKTTVLKHFVTLFQKSEIKLLLFEVVLHFWEIHCLPSGVR